MRLISRYETSHFGPELNVTFFGSAEPGPESGATLSNSDPRMESAVNAAYGLTAQIGVTLPHSRAQESEADHIGLIYMARAGYNPRMAVAFWQRFADFEKRQGGATTAFLRTHPTDAKRILQLSVWMPEAVEQYHPAP